ncbi:MAG: S8 family serine peptidase, partial [Bacteroidales bacterium]|nr:S8 family serine peptidase [Bacteroidales bacterium]
MKKHLLSLSLFMCAFIGFVMAQTINPLHVDGRVYFKINDDVNLNVVQDEGKINPKDVYFLQNLNAKYAISNLEMPFLSAKSDILQRTFKMDFDNMEMVEELIKELGQHPDIEYVENAPLFFISVVPDDPYYDTELNGGFLFGSANASWHLNLINAEDAWDVTTGDPNIVVAVLDNAIWVDHPDLQGKVVSAVDLGNNDDDPNPPEPTYIWSHGTHSAGLIAASSNNGIGVASIGYDISLMAVKLGDDASDGQSMAAGFEGIVWAADNGAHVINMSWGTPQYFQTMQNVVNYAYNLGCVLVGAAGNNGNGMETQMNPDIPINYVGYPAALEHVIAVGSCDIDDKKSDFSNYGTWLDVLSPGGYATQGLMGIGAFTMLSTTYNDAGDMSGLLTGSTGGAGSFGVSGKYDIMQGTSMAAPVTSGLCGLMLSANPDLTPEELTALLKSTCVNVDAQNPEFVDSLGAGRIDAHAAVLAAANSVAPLTADFIASQVVIPEGGSVDFTDLTHGTPITWAWEFEGGMPNVSTEQNPQGIVYNESGAYEVKLTVTDADGNEDYELKTYFILVGDYVGGASSAWVEQNTTFPNQYRGVFNIQIADPQTAWILTYDGTGGSITTDYAKTTDGGITWEPGVFATPDEMRPGDISAVSGDKAWVAMYDGVASAHGGIFHTSDGGETWVHQSTAVFNSFCNSVHMFNENDGVAMGDTDGGSFEIYTTNDGGDNWIKVPGAQIPNPQSNEGAWTGVVTGVNNTIWFGTSTGRIFRSTDKGENWEAFTTGEANVSRISFWDEQNGVIICQVFNQTTGQVTSWKMRRTTDGGETWNPINISGGHQFSDVSVVPGELGMIVAINISQSIGDNFSAYSMDYGTSWEMLDDSIQYTCVQFYDAATGWAGGFNMDANYGGIYKWKGIPNQPIYFASSPEAEVYEYELYNYDIEVVDPNTYDEEEGEEAPTLVISADDNLPAWLNLVDNGDGTAKLSGEAPQAESPSDAYNVTIYATDGENEITQNFVINVITTNLAPEFTSDPVTSHIAHLLYTYNITASDPDGDDLEITAVQIPNWAELIDNGDGTAVLTGTPTTTSMIGFSVKLKVSDGIFEDNQNFNIVTTSNQPPEFTSEPITVGEINEEYVYNVTAIDPEEQELSFEALVIPDWLSFVDNGDGTAVLSGIPTEGSAEGYEIKLQVSDGPNNV